MGTTKNERKDTAVEQHTHTQAFLLLAACSPSFSRARFHSVSILFECEGDCMPKINRMRACRLGDVSSRRLDRTGVHPKSFEESTRR